MMESAYDVEAAYGRIFDELEKSLSHEKSLLVVLSKSRRGTQIQVYEEGNELGELLAIQYWNLEGWVLIPSASTPVEPESFNSEEELLESAIEYALEKL